MEFVGHAHNHIHMYKEYFRLDRLPFLNTADPGFFFDSSTHREALAVMAYGIREGKGFVVITGGVGTGKTMLVQALHRELGEQHLFIDISSPWVSPDEVFAAIWRGIGLPTNNPSGAISPNNLLSLDTLKERLLKLDEEGRRVVLVVDEAHLLPERTLEGLRLFADLESYDRKLLQIVLLGQEELRSALKNHSLRALRDRIALTHHLDTLSASDTEAYIRHRIRAAGGRAEIFSPECFHVIYKVSRGSPRAINYLCDQCMLYAFGHSLSNVDSVLLREVTARVAQQMGGVEEERPSVPEVAFQSLPETKNKVDVPIESTEEKDQNFSLPFQLPTALHKELPSPDQKGSTRQTQSPPISGGGRFGSIVMSLSIGLLIGAIVVWVFLGKSIEFRLPITFDTGKKVSEAPKPLMSNQSNVVSMAASSPETKTLSVSPVAFASDLPLPTANPSAGTPQEVVVSPTTSLPLLASQQYGAWNATVRDIVAAANPTLGPLESIPDGTRVLLPLLNRDAMVVSKNGTQLYIFYGSFESEEAAARDVEALRRLSTSALVIEGISSGSKVYRLYVGPYANRNDANTVASSLWFKYIPGLS